MAEQIDMEKILNF